jgi:hypothetical protein
MLQLKNLIITFLELQELGSAFSAPNKLDI